MDVWHLPVGEEMVLDIQPSRYGFVVVPYLPVMGFGYNRTYFSVAAVLWDFRLHGYLCEHVEGTLYRFTKNGLLKDRGENGVC